MLNIEDCILVIIDIQEKLVNAAFSGDKAANCTTKLAQTANILNIPTIITEQYPKGLGATIKGIKTTEAKLIEKNSFSALLEPKFAKELKKYDKKQIILCGIETHICVLQTAADLIKKGYEVYVVNDACSSRNEHEYTTGIELIKQYGGKITCTEIVLFELLKTSKHPYFKPIQMLIK
jgi:nicotinamidase-related amidase